MSFWHLKTVDQSPLKIAKVITVYDKKMAEGPETSLIGDTLYFNTSYDGDTSILFICYLKCY